MLSAVFRPLLPVVAAALLLMAVVVAWIRIEPLPMPTPLQMTLSVLLVLAAGVLCAVARSVERAAAGHDDNGRSRGGDLPPRG